MLLLGIGESSDAYHMSAPHPEGVGARSAMRAALAAASLRPEDIDYINLHGTGTPSNDRSESQAVTSVFGPMTPCSSTKGATGHTLGASGALEAVISVLAIENGVMPGGVHTNTIDPMLMAHYMQGQSTRASRARAEQFFRLRRYELQFDLRPRRMTLRAYVDGIGVLGPGLRNWPEAAAVLSGCQTYQSVPTVLPAPTLLAAAERRRTGRVVKLALAVALEATSQAGADPSTLASVFSSSGGDGHNCHEICQALSLAAREISPTRFANSVHNAAAGYWSIATGAVAESTVLCAFDASFTAGLLEALTQVTVDRKSVLLVAYDTEYPQPLHAKRPLPDAFGLALVLTAQRGTKSLAQLDGALTTEDYDRLEDPALEALRGAIPVGRCLPLLRRLALREPGQTILEYLDVSSMRVQVEPCR